MAGIETPRVDESGRIVLPESLLASLGLKPGDVLTASVEADGLHVRRAIDERGLHRERGLLVYRPAERINVDPVALIREMRDERTRHILGEDAPNSKS